MTGLIEMEFHVWAQDYSPDKVTAVKKRFSQSLGMKVVIIQLLCAYIQILLTQCACVHCCILDVAS